MVADTLTKEINMISPALVKELREKTGAGMMDCKKALTETQGDLEAAVDWLRKKGLSAAAKKAGRVAAEGLVGVLSLGKTGCVVEVNAETDFVARNPAFQEFVQKTLGCALDHKVSSVEALEVLPMDGGTIKDGLTQLISVVGENMNLRRVQILSVNDGVVASYVHNSVAPNIGRIGVLVALESAGDKTVLADLAKKIAMHIAAAKPVSLKIEDVDPALLEREKAILIDQAQSSGRPAEVIQKMVEGRIRKFYEEIVLLEQAFVMDGKTKVADVVAQTAKELGTSVTLSAFSHFVLGEGIEKEEVDFAAEVQAQAQIKK